MFRYSCRSIRVLATESDKHHDSGPLSRVYREFDMIMQKSPVSLHQFETTINEIDKSIKIVYQSSSIGEADRKNAEKDMLTRAEIPQILIEPVRHLLFRSLPTLAREIDEAELYFMDVSGLGLTNDDSSMKRKRNFPMDAIQKISLRKEGKIRRCIRCGAFMEDALPHRNGNPLLALLGRACYCGSHWMLLDRDEIAQTKV